eukprot:4389706-Lingulodinium_polyedra.AAC.1
MALEVDVALHRQRPDELFVQLNGISLCSLLRGHGEDLQGVLCHPQDFGMVLPHRADDRFIEPLKCSGPLG